ncbi:MAG: hypothetical protein AB7S48_11140 [Bacteroidales bacterium]
MSKINYNIIGTILYTLILLLLFLLCCGFYFFGLNPCVILFWGKGLLLFSSSILGYFFSLVFRWKDARVFYVGWIPVILWLICFVLNENSRLRYIKSNTCKVRKVYVDDFSIGSSSTGLYLKYKKSDTKTFYIRSSKRENLEKKSFSVKKFKQGDSLLIIYPVGCSKLSIIYKPYPTKEEFTKCNDYGYYVNGQLYSKEEYEQMFGKNGTK